MSAGTLKAARSGADVDLAARLAFFKNMQAIASKIAVATNLDEIIQNLQAEICGLFNADRLTIYAVAEDRKSIQARIKSGANEFKDLRLPINTHSLAGYVATKQEFINISNVYDAEELQAIDENLHHLREVDRHTRYRTREVLSGPIVDPEKGGLVGVIQLINNKAETRFSDLMLEGLRVFCNTLGAAMARAEPLMLEIRSKYDYLVADGLISKAGLEEAANTAQEEKNNIEAVLLEQHGIEREAIGAALERYFGVPYEPFRRERIKSMDLYKNLKRDYVVSKQWLPLEDTPKGLTILCLDPEQVMGSGIVLQVFPGSKPIYFVTTIEEFNKTLDQMFGGGGAKVRGQSTGSVGDLLAELGFEDGDDQAMDDSYIESEADDNELVKLVNKIITDAYNQGASDIHIEPGTGKNKVLVRLRKDGSLVKYIEIPASYRAAIVARIKIMCDLDISERRKPQDGKIKFKKYSPLDIELRVATLPTTGNVEDIVMRILAAGEPIPLENLGVLPVNLDRLKQCISKPYGLFFVCGPTGSGKTTTLHSVLKFLNTPETKIWTAEDPVEITQLGLRQCQINKKAGLDFPVIMKAFLRADPDIIMVGEMRDADTTGIGIEASLTGHLVFATLHTNSAPESIIRLLDMGMDPFNFADALLGILAQRLAKRLCSKCKENYQPEQAEVDSFMHEYCSELAHTEAFKKDAAAAKRAVYERLTKNYGTGEKLTLCRPKGCDACDGTGYKGRVGLHELMVGTDSVKKLIQEHARVADLFAQALEDGMLTLKMDGMEKVLQGITDMKQVRAVCIK